MIFKGFTDENGNVIPVQGAGTVYNEEKNSIAIGKDTIASGQDQFVFGRKNYPDDGRYIIGLNPTLDISVNGVQRNILYNKALFSKEEEALEYIHTNNISQITSINMPEGVTEIKGYVVWQAITDGVTSKYIALFTHPIPQCEQGETVYTGIIGDSTITYSDSATFNSCDQIEYIAPDTYVEIVGNGNNESKSNARTLDWEGNEELGGYLKTDKLVFKNVTVIGGTRKERAITANEAFLMPVTKKVSSVGEYKLKNYADNTDTIRWTFPTGDALVFARTHQAQACILLAPANLSMGLTEWHPASGWSTFNKFTLWKACEFQDDAGDGARYMYEASIVCSATQGGIKHLFLKKEDYVTGTIKYYHYEPSQS